jgi:hypothetical protein
MSFPNKDEQTLKPGDEYSWVLENIDTVINSAPDYKSFKIEDIINDSQISIAKKQIARHNLDVFRSLLRDKLKYIEVHPQFNLLWNLTPLGQKVKKAGGHFSYLQKITDKEDADKERQHLTDEKLKYDVRNSKRIFKTYWCTFTFALISFIYVLIQIVLKIMN